MCDGAIVAAIEEEKLSREAHRGGLPTRAIHACLGLADATAEEVDCVALVRPLGTGADNTFQIRLRSLFPNARIVVREVEGQRIIKAEVTRLHPRSEEDGDGAMEDRVA